MKEDVVKEYILRFPKSTQKKLSTLRNLIRKEIPKATEVISYGIPTFKLEENVVHFGGFEKHVSLFPTSAPIAHFKNELKDYKVSRGTIQFPLDKPLPLGLIKKIVKWRVNQAKQQLN